MASGVTVKPVASTPSVALTRSEPPRAEQSVTTQLPPAKTVTAAGMLASLQNAARQNADPNASDKARYVLIDPQTQDVIYRVVDARRGQVVRPVPAESTLRLRAYMRAPAKRERARDAQADVEA
ncbi:MAG: hypothetical protein HY056_15915 [Proteobacteria bacterium]|nr:hypothetical protein [Pseudomonadota bacterium]